MTLGERLAALRNNMGKSQAQVARELSHMAGSTISRSALSLWELDVHQPDNDRLLLLASYYGVSTDYLLGSGAAKEPPKDDLEARWPHLSPDRRRRAQGLEMAAKGMRGTFIRFPRKITNDDFDTVMRGIDVLTTLVKNKPDQD